MLGVEIFYDSLYDFFLLCPSFFNSVVNLPKFSPMHAVRAACAENASGEGPAKIASAPKIDFHSQFGDAMSFFIFIRRESRTFLIKYRMGTIGSSR